MQKIYFNLLSKSHYLFKPILFLVTNDFSG